MEDLRYVCTQRVDQNGKVVKHSLQLTNEYHTYIVRTWYVCSNTYLHVVRTFARAFIGWVVCFR